MNLRFYKSGNHLQHLFIVLTFLSVLLNFHSDAQNAAPLRRPVSEHQPMWIIHIDTWNYADPQKIIDLIPADVRPYVVLNLSLSINHDSIGRFKVAEYGQSVVKSWLSVCAKNRMWAMIQCASGGMHQFSDSSTTLYEELYQEFPNLIGFNYAEQFWGFDDTADPVSAMWDVRIQHFANLLALSNQYGGYLVVSWCGNQYSSNINPIAMLKRSSNFAAASSSYAKNFILCEKYTTVSYQFDKESICLGAYLSGLSGQYGIRYDRSGWTDSSGSNANQNATYSPATSIAPYLEHAMLTGETIIDGPELIPNDQTKEVNPVAVSNGYTSRKWTNYPQFYNVVLDVFRKFLDSTIRIPSRQEVIDKTKYVIISNINTGSNDNIYSTPQTLFDSLYKMSTDGYYQTNKSFFKRTGRYPTIPMVYQLLDTPANSFSNQINKSSYAARWPTVASKIAELDTVFPSEYRGDIYAGRYENGWVIYNPYKTKTIANGTIPFKYNTCDSIYFSFSQYTGGVVKETTNSLKIYLNNYDNLVDTNLKTDIIKIYGSTLQPVYTLTDRASHQSSIVSANWSSGIFTLTVQHNGPIDIAVNCSGTGTNRLTNFTGASLTVPALPPVYNGPWQYEGEIFDYKNIEGVVSNGYSGNIRNYNGQGYLKFGTSAAAAIRKTDTVQQAGNYKIKTRYWVNGSNNINSIKLYVNGLNIITPVFAPTGSNSTWAMDSVTVALNAGLNTIEYKAQSAALSSVYFDDIVISSSSDSAVAGTMPSDSSYVIQENKTGFCGVDGTVDSNYSGYTGSGFANTYNGVGNGISWKVQFSSIETAQLAFRYAATNARTADLYINNKKLVSGIIFPSTNSWTVWDTLVVNVNVISGVSSVRLQATGTDGLPNIDYLKLLSQDSTKDCSSPVAYAIQENDSAFCSVDGTIDSNYSGYTGSGFANTQNSNGAGVNWMANFSSAGSKTFVFRYAATSSRTANLTINNNTALSSITFPATNSWSDWQTLTVSVPVNTAGNLPVRLSATSASGLPNLDYLQITGGSPVPCSTSVSLLISITDFDVSKQSLTALLRLTATVDLNNEGFQIQRSNDGLQWQDIGFMSNFSLAENYISYRYTDYTPLAGVNYYRIKGSTQNGDVFYTQVKSITFNDNTENTVTIHPNPAQDAIWVSAGVNWKNGDNLTIYDSRGTALYSQVIYGQVQKIKISDFPAGVYYVKISSGDAAAVLRKFVVLH